MILRKISLLLVVLFAGSTAFAHLPVNFKKKKVNNLTQFRNDCGPAEMAVDMDVNNVRARLRIGGDLWWDGQGQGRYVVPKPAPGFPEVSAIFSGGVWLGGLDPAGNLKAAITQYPNGNVTDFWPGPLDENGETQADVCSQWDLFFELSGDNVRNQIAAWETAEGDLNCDEIPDDVKYWPGRGNPYWAEEYTFDLPDQNLGAFWDQPGGKAGVYDPCEGDFPIINIRGCEPATRLEAKELVPDEMIFWIYNDAGNNHLETNADKIQMEIQVQAFAYATNDEVNDMSFLRYRLINKAIEDIEQCYFAMWMDPDLGCYLDDYIGCDVDRSLAYVYNEDALDGTVGDACPGGVNTYGSNIPILGLDYFRGPRGPKLIEFDENGDTVYVDPPLGSGDVDTLLELGMTSFAYTNSGANGEPPGTQDPNNGVQAYNVLRGLWPDGRPITFGGTIAGNSGYNDGTNTDTVRYVFPGEPNSGAQDISGWSMCTAELPFGDRRTIQATGPILLQAGGLPEELIVGAVFVPDLDYPCPNIKRLQFADDIAQSLFDNCFDITDGPTAPDMCAVELDQQLILLLSNDSLIANSNNAKQQYEELDLQAPATAEDPIYRFEGYLVYQLRNPAVTAQELDDIEKARLIRQVDLKNGVGDIPSFVSVTDPSTGDDIFVPDSEPAVEGADRGIFNTFNITTDAFTDEPLVNHTDYYFLVLAYAYNNYEDWNTAEQTGQRRPYLEGRNNVKTYTYTPRPIVYQELSSAYGQEAQITRISGVGTGTNALDLVEGEHEAILDGSADGIITYETGFGPISVKVVDPLNIKDGNYRLEIIGDHNDSRNRFETPPTWKLTNLSSNEVLFSEAPIDVAAEQIAYGQGFSVSVLQAAEPGNELDNNGAIAGATEYADPNGTQWWSAAQAANGLPLVDGEGNQFGTAFPFAENEPGIDPAGRLTSIGDAFWTPLPLTRWRGDNTNIFVTPNWKSQYGTVDALGHLEIEELNNVDIVMTSDKSKWSRCIVVESGSAIFPVNGLTTEGDAAQFELRRSTDGNIHPSVDVDGAEESDSRGLGWFPGYAIDVETGERLNIFFGENSGYNDERSEDVLGEGMTGLGNGDDMIWNPTNIPLAPDNPAIPLYNLYGGGQHFIYVTKTKYDECAAYRDLLSTGNSTLNRAAMLGSVTYTAFPLPSEPLLDISEGLIPNDVTFKIRVTNEFKKETDTDNVARPQDLTSVGDTPVYEFALSGVAATDREYTEEENPLDDVRVVPNPYYAYSSYETSQFDNSVKVTNLPARATVTIYSLDGKFIQQFRRDESPMNKEGSNPAVQQTQVYPALEWNLQNASGVPVASGVYIFHIEAPELNASKSIKWFGVNRRFDPTGL